MEHDSVKSPKHYTEGRKYEPKDVIRDWGLNFNLGNGVKYVSRAGRKKDNGIIQELMKAKEYIEFEIDYQINELLDKCCKEQDTEQVIKNDVPVTVTGLCGCYELKESSNENS